MSGIQGLRGTGDWSADERPKDFRNSILFLDPNGNAPIFALTGRAGKKEVTDPEFSWWAESQTIVRLAVNGSHAAGDTVITVDSADPSSSNMALNYGTATHLKPGDVLMHEPAAGAAYGSPEYLLVTEVLSDTSFTASREAAGTSAGTLADEDSLLLIGSSYGEGTAAPTAVSRNPVKFSNYTQIFKNTYELSGTATKTATRTGDPWSNDKKRKMFDHAKGIEHTLLYSWTNSDGTGANGKPLRYTKGLRGFIPSANTTVFSNPVTTDSLLAAMEPMWSFSAGGMGGEDRIGFIGMNGAIELAKVMRNDDSVQMNLGDRITMWGMNFRELIMPWGRLLLKTHPLLSQHATFKKSMYVMDFAALKYAPLRGRDTKPKDDVQADDEDVRRGFYQTEAGWFVDAGGLTMGVLDNVSST